MGRHPHHHSRSDVGQNIIGHVDGHLFAINRVDRDYAGINTRFLFRSPKPCLLGFLNRFVNVIIYFGRKFFPHSPPGRNYLRRHDYKGSSKNRLPKLRPDRQNLAISCFEIDRQASVFANPVSLHRQDSFRPIQSGLLIPLFISPHRIEIF